MAAEKKPDELLVDIKQSIAKSSVVLHTPVERAAMAAAVRAEVEPNVLVRITCDSIVEFDGCVRVVVLSLGVKYDRQKTQKNQALRLCGELKGLPTIELTNGSAVEFDVWHNGVHMSADAARFRK